MENLTTEESLKILISYRGYRSTDPTYPTYTLTIIKKLMLAEVDRIEGIIRD